MDGANADSDHSMTWEDFFGSTTDLTPTLIGIYDSLLEPDKKTEVSRLYVTAKDARNEPPLQKVTETTQVIIETKTEDMKGKGTEPIVAHSVKLPVNRSTLYNIRTKVTSESVSEVKKTETNAFDHLSPNVKRMISSATDSTALKFQKKSVTGARASIRGHKSNIPLVGATSKISQSGVEILPSVEIHDQVSVKNAKKEESPSKIQRLKPNFKIDSQEYDVPTNNKPAFDVTKTAFEALSLPYIDQSIELSISTDREFDPKIASKETSPQKDETSSPPSKIPKTGTNSWHRQEFGSKSVSPAKQLAKSELYPEAVGSTGNLGKEVTRLNPPSVEVTRPLSMSSIASSSSTSSSGVQNKGGVNSAYLASIESLDDHSDADMISAGSNNFVNDAGINKGGSEDRRSEVRPREQCESSGPSQLERVCAEIVHTENAYVQDLEQVVEGYLHVWRREGAFSADELADLFNNIEDIYNFNKSLCAELNSCSLDETCIARCFVNNTSGFSVYTSYCTGYPRTMERLAALASSQESAREFRERQLALGHPLPLASYLLKPVQRILKYHLLLQNVVKYCASSDTEYAFLKMTGIAQHIDDMKRKHEHAVRVQEIQSLLYGWNGPDLTTYGELCAEGTFRVFGAKAMRHAFLFDNMLLITKNREDGVLAYKSHIMCNNMMLVESIAGAPLSFHVIPWDAPRSQLTLQASSQRHKREWTLLLKRVILENYNAVIPSHARQLVMELGQNKTDDDMLAEKSHNLITQASMRKQLSAPEYLEKRKLDRERRKTFDNNPRGRPKKINRKNTAPNIVKEIKCDCAQVSIEKGIDYTCEICYVDLCSDCEMELKKKDVCNCNDDGNKCPECDRSLHYIDAGSAEHLERKLSTCKCSDFKSSQESFNKDFLSPLNKTRGYHSSDNIVGYTDNKSKEDLTDINNSMANVRNMPKTCLKCVKIKENIVVTDSTDTLPSRVSRCHETDKHSTRSKSKDDPHRVKLSKIRNWRRKSEPGLQQNNVALLKKTQDSDSERNDKGCEKIEFECRNCGSNKISGKSKNNGLIISDPDLSGKRGIGIKQNVEINMYNTKKVPKKISKLKKNRAKGLQSGSATTSKFYTDLSTDVSTENILHISESTDSLNVDKVEKPVGLPESISKDESIDEETYKKLIEKTDSFKKNELEKVKFLNKQKVINEGSEDETNDVEIRAEEVLESCEETEQPLEQIISQLLLQNREFQKLLKKQQLRNTAHRRHQRLLKSHSNPEQPNPPKSTESSKLKPKYGRQMSETVDMKSDETKNKVLSNPNDEDLDDDHIYETLRVETRVDENLNSTSKANQHNSRIARPTRLPSPTDPHKNITKMTNPESDYVYLSFDKLDKIDDMDGIYDVPVKSPEKVADKAKAQVDYYVTVERKGPILKPEEDIYDNIIEVCRRKKEPPTTSPGEYLPMSPEHSPNTPEIWLSRQKEHFNVSRDRKSGSLPRSFQVVSTTQEEPNMTTFKTKSSNSKTYLNRDGKVLSIERPFTIASDQSEISFDDVETYMNEGDILKYNKKNYKTETDPSQNISQSTLELEEEIDRCYKTNFESIKLQATNNDNLNASIPNLNTSTTSSCEVLSADKKDINMMLPEHKIYKPTSNILSLKNVLSRFKTRKSTDETEINANQDQTSENGKSDLKSPTSEKRSALNPRNYSRNLLQRFRNIIGDEGPDDNQNKHEKGKKSDDTILTKSDVKVVITSTDVSPSASTIVSSDALSKSVYGQTTLTESQNERNNLDILSHSCDNITKPDNIRPNFEKSVSMITTISSSVSSATSPTKSVSNSSLYKLPIYMQGSKCLGARIAQSNYVDPSTLMTQKASLKNVNVLINKSAVRPDSLFSNSSFVTSSSEGTFKEIQKENATETMETVVESKSPESGTTISDDSFYEKSFEKIEQLTDNEVFRDSAVYSDQEDTEDSKTESSGRGKTVTKSTKTVDSVVRNSSFKTEKVKVSSNVTELKTVMHTKVTVVSKAQVLSKTEPKPQINQNKPKLAPPVPVKPKITNIPTTNMFQHRNLTKSTSLTRTEESSSTGLENIRTIKRNTNLKSSFIRSESTPQEKGKDVQKTIKDIKNADSDLNDGNTKEEDTTKLSSIQMKRLSFERASLDSATRKLKNNTLEAKRISMDAPKSTTKSVMERTKEIESLSKTKVNSIRKPSQLAKPKVFTQKSEEESKNNESSQAKTKIQTQEPNNEEDAKGSWVKTVVNKFQ